MKKNVSTLGRITRLILAIIFIDLSLAKILTGPWTIIGWVAAGIFLLTAIAGTCPLYSLMGISSCPKKNRSH